jgi:hypothetical protein
VKLWRDCVPLAVADVCAIRGVQTEQVGILVSHMDQADVTPARFIEVFRYVPVALVLSTGERPDFVRWVGGEVARGVSGDELVLSMERQLRTYDRVVPVSRSYRHRPRQIYRTVFAEEYVPVRVRRYCSRALLDPYALIDMPVAVAHLCDIGVPYDRVGRLVVELNRGYVEPWQTVEVLRDAPPALVVADVSQPDFVQFVFDQRAAGLTGHGLVRAIDRRLPDHGRGHGGRGTVIAAPRQPEPRAYPVAPSVAPPRPPGHHGRGRGGRREVPAAQPFFAPPAPQAPPVVTPPAPPQFQGPPGQNKEHEHGQGHGHKKGKGQ